MKIVSITKYDDYRIYLKDILELNQKSDKKFSYRFFAKKLNWPVSFLADVLAKRRGLTLSRALEFARWLDMNSTDTEYLIYLVMQDNQQESVREYASKQRQILFNDSYFEDDRAVKPELFDDLELLAVYSVYVRYRRLISAVEVLSELTLFPELTTSKIEIVTRFLLERSYIVQGEDEILEFPNNLFLDQPNNPAESGIIHSRYSKVFQRYCDNGASHCHTINSAFILLDEARYNEIRKRLLMTRNWIFDIVESLEKEKIPPEKTKIYQLDINLFPFSPEGWNPTHPVSAE